MSKKNHSSCKDYNKMNQIPTWLGVLSWLIVMSMICLTITFIASFTQG